MGRAPSCGGDRHHRTADLDGLPTRSCPDVRHRRRRPSRRSVLSRAVPSRAPTVAAMAMPMPAQRGDLERTLTLRHAGATRVRVRWECVGDVGAPAVVVLGGISANRHLASNAVDAELRLVAGPGRPRPRARRSRAPPPDRDRLAGRRRCTRPAARHRRSGRRGRRGARRARRRPAARVRRLLVRRDGRARVRRPPPSAARAPDRDQRRRPAAPVRQRVAWPAAQDRRARPAPGAPRRRRSRSPASSRC